MPEPHQPTHGPRGGLTVQALVSREGRRVLWSALAVFIIVAATLLFGQVPVGREVRVVLELLNGATWSDDWQCFQRANRVGFAVLVGIRTAATWAPLLAVVLGTVWFFSRGWRLIVKMSMAELVRLHEGRLVAALITTLQQRHEDLVVSDEDLDAVYETAARVYREIEEELESGAHKPAP